MVAVPVLGVKVLGGGGFDKVNVQARLLCGCDGLGAPVALEARAGNYDIRALVKGVTDDIVELPCLVSPT